MKARVSQLLRVASAAVVIASGPASQAALDMFLKIEGVEGESTDKVHPRELNVLSYSIGHSNSYDVTNPEIGGSANFQSFNCTTFISKATPTLNLAAARGTHYSTVKLTLRKAGTTQVEFYVITLTDVIVTSASSGANSGEDAPTENYTMSFGAIEWAYTPTLSTGLPGQTIRTSFDVRLGK